MSFSNARDFQAQMIQRMVADIQTMLAMNWERNKTRATLQDEINDFKTEFKAHMDEMRAYCDQMIEAYPRSLWYCDYKETIRMLNVLATNVEDCVELVEIGRITKQELKSSCSNFMTAFNEVAPNMHYDHARSNENKNDVQDTATVMAAGPATKSVYNSDIGRNVKKELIDKGLQAEEQANQSPVDQVAGDTQ